MDRIWFWVNTGVGQRDSEGWADDCSRQSLGVMQKCSVCCGYRGERLQVEELHDSSLAIFEL